MSCPFGMFADNISLFRGRDKSFFGKNCRLTKIINAGKSASFRDFLKTKVVRLLSQDYFLLELFAGRFV